MTRSDRVPDELRTEVHDIVQETGSKTITKKKKGKKAKCLSEQALQIAVKIREVKSKGEKERYIHLNPYKHEISEYHLVYIYSPNFICKTPSSFLSFYYF